MNNGDDDVPSPSGGDFGGASRPEIQKIAQEWIGKKIEIKAYPLVKLMMQRHKNDDGSLEDDEDRKNARNNPSSDRWKRLEKNVVPEFVQTVKSYMKSYRQNFIPLLDETQERRDKYMECSTFEDALFEFQLDPHKGCCYQGQWLRGKRHGLGMCFWPNHVVFNGYWEKDVPISPGQIIKLTEQIRYLSFYSGDLVDFLREGYGEYGQRDLWYGYIYTYKGYWQKDLKNGDGKESYSNEHYDGMFVNDKREGSGKCTFRNLYTYNGEWKANKMHGKGVYKMGDKTYEGQMAYGFMEGKGKLTNEGKNRVYEGDFHHDAFHGQGKLTWNDGRYYEGSWDFGVQHGDGEFRFPDGKVKKGTWQEGKNTGWFVDLE